MRIPTIAIVNEESDSGYSIINESDFDPDSHKKFDAYTPDPSPSPYAGKSLTELRDLAKGHVEGKISAMKKGELIEALESIDAAPDLSEE